MEPICDTGDTERGPSQRRAPGRGRARGRRRATGPGLGVLAAWLLLLAASPAACLLLLAASPAACLLLLAASPAAADSACQPPDTGPPAGSRDDTRIHMGVGSCASAPCHGAAAPEGKRVLQNEYVTWLRRDPHARAFRTLCSDESARIARNLALPVPAWEAPECLACHADYVPVEQRGEEFTLADGVGCEACHGGAGGVAGEEGWLRAHALSTTGHAENVARGLRPIDRPAVRAGMCLDCHLGNTDQMVTHRIMGAGHPRLVFELDTFTSIEPAHFRLDEDYRERGKEVNAHATLWAVGQAVSVERRMELLSDPAVSRHGIWPEYVFFDCYTCHHPLSELRWTPRPGTGLAGEPGVARLDDANLLMLRRVLSVVEPGLGEQVGRETLALHAALSRGRGSPSRAVANTAATARAALPTLEGWQPTAEQVRRLASGLAAAAQQGYYRDYAASEQAVMAIQSLAATLHQMGDLDDAALARVNATIESLLARTRDPERFEPGSVPPELAQLRAELQ